MDKDSNCCEIPATSLEGIHCVEADKVSTTQISSAHENDQPIRQFPGTEGNGECPKENSLAAANSHCDKNDEFENTIKVKSLESVQKTVSAENEKGKQERIKITSDISRDLQVVNAVPRRPSSVPPRPKTIAPSVIRSATPPSRPPRPSKTRGDKKPQHKFPPYNPLLNPFYEDMLEEEEAEKASTVDQGKAKEKQARTKEPYDERLNPFAGDSDEEDVDKSTDISHSESVKSFENRNEEKKTQADNRQTPKRVPPPRPPPVSKARPAVPPRSPTAPKATPVVETSLGKRFKNFFKGEKKESITEKQQAVKWICVEPVKPSKYDHLRLKKGQKVKQLGEASEDGYAYGCIKKGLFRRKVKGYFPLANVRLAENE